MEATQFSSFKYGFVSGLSDELECELHQDYAIEELDIEDVFTNTQLSKVEARPDYLYVALHFPEFDKSLGKFAIKEVHCFVSETFLLVIDKNEHKHTLQFNNLKNSLFDESLNAYELFYEMLDFVVTKDFRAITLFRSELSELEQDIFEFDIHSDLIKDILILKRNISTFYSVITPLASVVNDLKNKYFPKLSTRDVERIDDSLDKLKKMINNIETMEKHVDLLSESNNALIARSTNEVIRTLTSISIIALIPTIIFSFFGMNVYFGWPAESGIAPLLMVIVLSIALTGLSLYYFKKRGWI